MLEIMGVTTKYEYDKNGQLTKLTNPAGDSITYSYDAVGNLVKEKQKDGSSTTYQYDNMGNMKKITYADSRSISYTYNDNYLVNTMTDWNGTTSYTYDAVGNVTSVTDAKNQKVEYTWTSLGQKKSITYPNGETVRYTYDANGNLTKVTDTLAEVTTYTYDALNKVVSKTMPNGASSTYVYDSVGQLAERKEKIGSTVKDSFTYQYDKNGNRTKETKVTSSVTETTTYTYDALNQLTTVTDKEGIRKYTFDEFNNRTSKEETGKDRITYSYNSLNQLIEEKQGSDITSYSYDNLGNLSEVQENGITTKVYQFDSTNKLTKMITTEAVTDYGYDGDGNRISAKVTKGGVVASRINYVVDKESAYQNIIMASDSIDAHESSFTYGNEQVSVETDGNISYYRTDEQGSITQILSATGSVQADIQYDEYGVVLNPEAVGTNGNIFAYTGHVYDESTGLTYAKARYYDARVGRFISEDSYRVEQSEPIAFNLYTYVKNNPIHFIDPSGHIAVEWSWLIEVDGPLPIGDLLFTVIVVIDGVKYYKKVSKENSKYSSKTKQGSKAKVGSKTKDNESNKNKSKQKKKIGENGTKVSSKTTGQNGKTERIDVENPNPGQRDGEIHYHEPNNTKWRYEIESKKLVDPKTGIDASTKIQKVLVEQWVKKAIKKALEILGE